MTQSLTRREQALLAKPLASPEEKQCPVRGETHDRWRLLHDPLLRPAAPTVHSPAASSSSRPAARPLRSPAAVMKAVFNKNKRGTDKDARSSGRWLFATVPVGRKAERSRVRTARRGSPFAFFQSLQ